MSRIALFTFVAALLFLTFRFFTPIMPGGDLGLCLPSPNQWHLPQLAGWLINTVLIFLSAGIMTFANKEFNFIPDTKSIMPFSMLLLLACNCISTATLSTSTLLLLCNVLCILIIISTYEARNAAKEFFIVGTLPAIGAMTQYAFLLMIPVYIAGGILMKSFKIREFIAFIFGLIAPYWIAIGLGWVSPFTFQFPDTLMIFNKDAVESDVFYTLLAAGGIAVIGLILSLYNGVKLFSRNSRLRCMQLTFDLLGYISILAAIFDFNNFVAYFGSLALWCAVEIATFLHFYKVRYPSVALAIILVIFFPLYILAI